MRPTLLRVSLTIGLFFLAVSQSREQRPADSRSNDPVMKVDEEFRLAKLHKDTATLNRILSENFYEMNQNGNGRNKAQFIELFKAFPIAALTTDAFDVRITGDTASVTGSQTENNTERMLFLRVYVKGQTGWLLVSSMRSRNPQ